ncbi:MAG: dienelactone hydrolase family protein [Campylobacteraceae bacterium]|nr:dienelactone hydrolase family protein [Campylobacteraceae bacterium]
MKVLASIIFFLGLASSLLASGSLVTYSVDGKEYEGYYISPSKNSPLVLIVHDWDGMNEYEMKRAQMLNDLGYAAFAVDLFGKGVKPQTVDEKKAITASLYKDRAKMRTLLDAGLKTAKDKGANVANAVGIGYCFGGTALLEMARSGSDLKGFAIFHGGLATPEGQDYKKTKGDIIIFHGSADTSVSLAEFAGLIGELETTKIKHEAISYSGAPHAFSVFGTERYKEDADRKSWDRFVGYLKETLH